jgi:hypothetical protein
MSPITISITSSQIAATRAMLEQLGHWPAPAMRSMLVGARLGAQVLLGRIKRERFTGKGPFPVSDSKLGVRAGMLRRSLNATLPEMSSRSEILFAIGSDVKYFAPHEFGATGSARVRAHTRRLKKFATTRTGKKKHVSDGISYVEEHTRKFRVPERRMVRTGVEQHGGAILGKEIVAELQLLIQRGGDRP